MSAPLTQLVASGSPRSAQFKGYWERLMDTLDASGHEVFSAHRREAWGTRLDPPESALAADLGGLRWCEIVIAYVGNPFSPGVQLELGYSLALGRRLIVFIDEGQAEPYLMRGLPAVADAELVEIADIREIGAALVSKRIASAEPEDA